MGREPAAPRTNAALRSQLEPLWANLGLGDRHREAYLDADPRLIPELLRLLREDPSEDAIRATRLISFTVERRPDATLHERADDAVDELAKMGYAGAPRQRSIAMAISMRTRIGLHVGTEIRSRRTAAGQGLLLVISSSAELLQHIRPVYGVEQTLDRQLDSDSQRRFMAVLQLRLHGFLAAVTTIADYTRELVKLASGPTYKRLWDSAGAALRTSQLAGFLINLRDIALHLQTPPARPMIMSNPPRSEVVIIPGDIAYVQEVQLRNPNPAGLQFLESWGDEPIPLSDLVTQYVTQADPAVSDVIDSIEKDRRELIEESSVLEHRLKSLYKEIAQARAT